MPSEETNRLLAELGELKQELQADDPESRRRFEKAVAVLNKAGNGPAAPGNEFEGLVWELLSRDPEFVTARDPRAAGTTARPDFVVDVSGRRVLVGAKASKTQARRAADELERALPSFNADSAFIVVPDAVAVWGLERPGVRVAHVSELAEALRAA